jgi:hypothetical protein
LQRQSFSYTGDTQKVSDASSRGEKYFKNVFTVTSTIGQYRLETTNRDNTIFPNRLMLLGRAFQSPTFTNVGSNLESFVKNMMTE